MIDDLASCVLTTRARTWIFAFLIDARHILTTFRTDNTLGTTIWGTTDKIWQTRAHGMIVQFTALTIQTAR